ncbi:MAG: Ni/Fe hydrogenase subunit alpha [Candidatus Helarchaeota archaeon]|nr:Ni/Fe hydrogenase subunit alpha [Candidatus Helarchaeota archaeon]
MSEEVKNINVATRVEGHAKITFLLDKRGQLLDAHFHVTEFKGFEKFMQGRMFYDAPRITTRACGICPVSHHLASAKACDDLLGVDIPETAKLLRELMHMGQMIHSHALHFFFLAAPDFILGSESKPEDRNVVGLLKKDPELVKKAIEIRKFGHNLIELIGGKAIHPVTAIPGGMSKGITQIEQEKRLSELKQIFPIYNDLLDICKSHLIQNSEFINNFSVIETNFVGLTKNGAFELYDGNIRVTDNGCHIIDDMPPNKYFQGIAEHVEPWTYLKFPFLKIKGWPNGIYRVGPLARLNICESMRTPKAQQALKEFRALYGRPANQTLAYHLARLIELLYALERAKELLEDKNLISTNIRKKVERTAGEGIGVVEAPRGTLIHHYKANSNGKLIDVNLIVATVNNNAAINQSIKVAARQLIQDGNIPKDGLNRIEMAIRAYDPCLTCAAHSINQMEMEIQFIDENGKLIKKIYR